MSLFTRSDKGTKQGQMQDLERENSKPALPTPAWVREIIQEIRALGDIMRLREALAVAHRDVERFRVERDKLIRTIQSERTKVLELEEVITRQMKGKSC
jgi:hypothetical protein